MTPEEHAAHLRAFEVDRLLKLVALEAKKHYDGHYAIFSFTSGYKVAFGTPDMDAGRGRSQLERLPAFPTLKAALITALVSAQTFADATPSLGTDDLVWGTVQFGRHGHLHCQGKAAFSHGGTSPVCFWCECGAEFLFADCRPEHSGTLKDPISEAIMHIHRVHDLPIDVVTEMFRCFPEMGTHVAAQQAALAGG